MNPNRHRIHSLLRRPWLVPYIVSNKRPSTPIVQILEVQPPSENRELGYVNVADGYNSIKAALTREAIQEFQRLKGSMVSLVDYCINPNSQFTYFLMVISNFNFIGDEGCFPFGDPYPLHTHPQVEEWLKVKREEMQKQRDEASAKTPKLDDLMDNASQEMNPDELEISASQLQVLNNLSDWSTAKEELPMSQAVAYPSPEEYPYTHTISSLASTSHTETPICEDFYSDQEPLQLQDITPENSPPESKAESNQATSTPEVHPENASSGGHELVKNASELHSTDSSIEVDSRPENKQESSPIVDVQADVNTNQARTPESQPQWTFPSRKDKESEEASSHAQEEAHSTPLSPSDVNFHVRMEPSQEEGFEIKRVKKKKRRADSINVALDYFRDLHKSVSTVQVDYEALYEWCCPRPNNKYVFKRKFFKEE